MEVINIFDKNVENCPQKSRKKENKMEILNQKDKRYPKKLLEIKNAPIEIYAEGNCELLNKDAIAIVGTRKPTPYGEKYAKIFAKEIAESGICVVSGMAIGIDTIAHINSMKEIGKTIAVLGSGFNHIYPKENKYLYKKIIENGGCIITEYSPETEVSKSNFPLRNRIVSGLSMGILVVEATYRSGTTITAKYAMQQKKDVFCIPNRLDIATGYSTNLLIKNGANLVMEPQDIIKYYKNEEDNFKDISEEYKEIYELIGRLPITANEISKMTGKTISQVMQTLSMLELEGLIKSIGANKFIKMERGNE